MYFRRKKSSPLSPVLINGRTFEIIQHFEFLGSTIFNHLKWEINIDTIVNKAQLRLHFLRRFRSFRLKTLIRVTFYRAAIDCVLTLNVQSQYVWIYQSEGKAQIEQSYKKLLRR